MMLARWTLVVSRRRDVERRARFVEQARAVNLEGWSFFDAIDPELGKLATSAESLHGRKGRPVPEPLSSGELGCLLSHMAIWRVFAAMGGVDGGICVLEDDVEFDAALEAHWPAFVASVPDDVLAVHLAGEPMHDLVRPEPVNDEVARVRGSYGTRGMVLMGGALQLLSGHPFLDTCNEPADWLLPRLFDTKRVYCPRRPLVRHGNAPGITPPALDPPEDPEREPEEPAVP